MCGCGRVDSNGWSSRPVLGLGQCLLAYATRYRAGPVNLLYSLTFCVCNCTRTIFHGTHGDRSVNHAVRSVVWSRPPPGLARSDPTGGGDTLATDGLAREGVRGRQPSRAVPRTPCVSFPWLRAATSRGTTPAGVAVRGPRGRSPNPGRGPVCSIHPFLSLQRAVATSHWEEETSLSRG